MMTIECAYSFDDLYCAAFKKKIPLAEKKMFFALPQSKINKLVASWAKKAEWHTQKRMGTDGKDYLAFAPEKFEE